MSAVFPDLYASSGFRVVSNFSGSSTSVVLAAFRDALLAANWTLLSSSTDDYTLISQQVPYWNPLVSVPSDYKMKVKVRLYDHSFPSIIAGNESDTMVQDDANRMLITVGNDYRIVANNFQFVWYAPGLTTGLSDSAGIVSCIHTPKKVQQAGLVECIIAQNWSSFRATTYATAGSRMFVASKKSGGSNLYWSGDASIAKAQPQTLAPIGPAIPKAYISDTYKTSPTHWLPLIFTLPIGWGDTPSSTKNKLKGFFWDMIQVTKSYPNETILHMDGKKWVNFQFNSDRTSTWFLCIGDV